MTNYEQIVETQNEQLREKLEAAEKRIEQLETKDSQYRVIFVHLLNEIYINYDGYARTKFIEIITDLVGKNDQIFTTKTWDVLMRCFDALGQKRLTVDDFKKAYATKSSD